MQARILDLVERLRHHDVAVSVAETLDAVRAVAAAGVERPVLRDALGATLCKDERHRATFVRLFDEVFPLPAEARRARRRSRSRGRPSDPMVEGRRGMGDGGGDARRDAPEPAPAAAGPDPVRAPQELREARAMAPGAMVRGTRPVAQLVSRPWQELTATEVAEARPVIEALAARLRARLMRRQRRMQRGRVDVRRMLRAAVASGGVPLRILRRGRRPDRPDLVALLDVSGSVAAASEVLLGLLAPLRTFFRRVDTFAYVDHLCPVTVEGGHLVPDGPLDLHARSDLGQVLVELLETRRRLLGGRTLLLVLGDARNNRRPPRADVLRAVRGLVQRVVWLAPEARARWNTGDSVIGLYAPACDAVYECRDPATLLSALGRTL